jgi:hypothetical protein
MIKFLVVMLATFLVDMAWTYYTLAVTRGSAIAAGLWSAGIVLLSAGVVVSYVGDPWLIGAAALGVFLGTVFAIKRKHLGEAKPDSNSL